MTDLLPTMQAVEWSTTRFHDALLELLRAEGEERELRLYFYAVTREGWRLVEQHVRRWGADPRRVVAYVGTDHALTDPNALEQMSDDRVVVRLMQDYAGVYHPKVAWFVNEANAGVLLAGSNNLTLDGLRYNIEFATVTRLAAADAGLLAWHEAIQAASVELTPALLDSYRREREAFGARRAETGAGRTFTWSRRTGHRRIAQPERAGPTLILEIMDRETGNGGNQVQIPARAAGAFFGLAEPIGESTLLRLRNAATGDVRALTMTRYANRTTRLVIRELDYRDRPCVIVFRRRRRAEYDFEIVRESIEPERYRQLLEQCGAPTRVGSRRWAIVPRG